MDGMVGVGRCVIRIKIIKLIRIKMRKESRAMDSEWALEGGETYRIKRLLETSSLLYDKFH